MEWNGNVLERAWMNWKGRSIRHDGSAGQTQACATETVQVVVTVLATIVVDQIFQHCERGTDRAASIESFVSSRRVSQIPLL
jgi:hypothetical protein